MHVYGDIERSEAASAVAAGVANRLERCRTLPHGVERHGELVGAFIACSALVQGIADRERGQVGADELSDVQHAGARLLLELARAIAMSWDTGFADLARLDARNLALLSAEEDIRTKQAEGYAFYALYPESYLEAARQSGLGPDTTVIGIRSIGVGLAAMVAAGLGTAPAVSIRPVGHPFDRRMQVDEGLATHLLSGGGDFAVVDEGPGLSGSSFNCVADWLVKHGISEDRIHFFPSHRGDLGSQAKPAHRERWAKARKHVAEFEQVLLDSGRLESWVAGKLGPLTAAMQDVSGGGWRTPSCDLSPADPAMEKRKFLVQTAEGRWLAKFTGLGESGERKLALAEALGQAGFAPPPVGICYGFMLTPWIDHLPTAATAPPRERVLDYLAFRAGLPAHETGAGVQDLFSMAAYNLGQSLGPEAAVAAQALLGDASRFDPQPCCTDNRMHAWEWVHGSGGWIKLDGLDHHAAHDLVGCQHIAWDLAGAAVELEIPIADLGPALYARLGRPFDPCFAQAVELCYLGFQIGLWTMATARNDPAEQARIERQISRYRQRARLLLS